MAITLPDSRGLSDEVLEALRLRALRGRELGFTAAGLADLLGVSPEAVCRWWRGHLDAGTAGLPGRRTGRPGSGRSPSPGQCDHTRYLTDHHAPEGLGAASPLRGRRAVRDLIRRPCGVDLAARAEGECLERRGRTAERPQRQPRDQAPEQVREWVGQTHPAVEERAEEEGARISRCDGAGSGADHHPGRAHAREARRATREVPRPHAGANQIPAIGNSGAVRFTTPSRAMGAALSLVSLGRLPRGTTGKVFLIVGRPRAHGTAEVGESVAARGDRVELPALPWAPERNALGCMQDDPKGRIDAEGLPGSEGGRRGRFQRLTRGLLSLPGHVKSYFRHTRVQYASDH